jgi:hypothetical protein
MWNYLFNASFVTLLFGLGTFQAPVCGTEPNIKQTILLQDLRGRLPRHLTGHLYLDIYPAKRTADPAKRDFELVMYVRGDDDKEIGVNAVHSETVFRAEAANYFHYLLRHKVRPADIPHSYIIELDLHSMESLHSLVIELPPLPGPICTPMVWYKATNSSLAQDSTPVCKCPPGPCTGCPKGIQPQNLSKAQSKANIYSSQLARYAGEFEALKN